MLFKKSLIMLTAVMQIFLLTACSGKFVSHFQEPNTTVAETPDSYDEQQSAAESMADGVYENINESAGSSFDEYIDRFNGDDGSDDTEKMPLGKRALMYFYKAYAFIRTWAPAIAIIAVVFGTLLAIFSKFNKGARRFGIVVAIGIPLLLLVIVFGVGWLNSIYLY